MSKKFENKKSRVSWTMKRHNKFVDAVNQLGGIDEAVPRNILELMDDENLTRMNVASHLQKYREKLRKSSSSSSVEHQQLGSLSDSGQFHNTAFNSFPTTELIGPSNFPLVQSMHELSCYRTNHFGQNNITNSELNFPSAIGHGHENCFPFVHQNMQELSCYNVTNHFDQNNNTNGEHNFQSAIGHGHENCFDRNFPNKYPDPLADMYSQEPFSTITPSQITITDALTNSVTLVNGAVDPKAKAATDSTFNSNLDSYLLDTLMWNLTESSSSYQESPFIAQLRQENDPLIQLNSSTEPTLGFTPEQQQ